jgi:hypothetical protein
MTDRLLCCLSKSVTQPKQQNGHENLKNYSDNKDGGRIDCMRWRITTHFFAVLGMKLVAVITFEWPGFALTHAARHSSRNCHCL